MVWRLNSQMGVWTLAIISMGLSIAMLYAYLRVSHYFHWFDKPDEQRKLHQIAKPTSAGLIFMLPLLLSSFIFPSTNTLGLALLLLLVLGGVDDFKVISVKLRLLVIIAVSMFVLYVFFAPFRMNYLLLGFYLLGLVWWMNLYNFMDGADGMATLHALVAMLGYVLAYGWFASEASDVLIYMLLFSGGLLAFLVFNFPVASMFMGDAGSLSVAFVLACFALYGLANNIFDETLVISFHLLFIVDATLTLLTRIRFKQRLSQAHRLHLYQCLIAAGRGHALVSFYYAMVSLILVLLTIMLNVWSVSLLNRTVVLLLEAAILSYFWFFYHNKTKFKHFVK
jgi:UDP-N-acetylmuramyl pentapeptide phosphotransferase/UDP-N-acetylglucosamine-1-phosphate transferase